MLEQGVAPWQKPWETGVRSLELPFNLTSQRAYRGQRDLSDGHRPATRLRRPEVDDVQAGLRQWVAGARW
jgi:hypothetical protein